MVLLSTLRALFKLGRGPSTAAAASPRSVGARLHNPNLPVKRCVVDNRVFLLGLDHLYRDAIQPHERGELLTCARTVASALDVAPATGPVEGYYADDPLLTEYFQLTRALQFTPVPRKPEAERLPEFRRLLEVRSAPLYGRPEYGDGLLPVGRNALSEALQACWPEWTVNRLTAAARAAARDTDDYSLVGLAARAADPVALAALGESVVLYSPSVTGALPPPLEFVWRVDDDLAKQAGRFVQAFRAVFGEDLPQPHPRNAEVYWVAYVLARILGRCVRLGQTQDVPPLNYYWAICRTPTGEPTVQEFWHRELWTTARYRQALRPDGGAPPALTAQPPGRPIQPPGDGL